VQEELIVLTGGKNQHPPISAIRSFYPANTRFWCRITAPSMWRRLPAMSPRDSSPSGCPESAPSRNTCAKQTSSAVDLPDASRCVHKRQADTRLVQWKPPSGRLFLGPGFEAWISGFEPPVQVLARTTV